MVFIIYHPEGKEKLRIGSVNGICSVLICIFSTGLNRYFPFVYLDGQHLRLTKLPDLT